MADFLDQLLNPDMTPEMMHDPDAPNVEYIRAHLFPEDEYCWEMIGLPDYAKEYVDTFFGALIQESLATVERIEDWCHQLVELFSSTVFVDVIREVCAKHPYNSFTAELIKEELRSQFPEIVEDAEGFWQILAYLGQPLSLMTQVPQENA